MAAARRFRDKIEHGFVGSRVSVELFGSLGWTGQGHATDCAICLGLLGEQPDKVDPDTFNSLLAVLAQSRQISLENGRVLRFDPEEDIEFDRKTVFPFHSSAMRFPMHTLEGSLVVESLFYSVGGGFVASEDKIAPAFDIVVPHAFGSAAELLMIADVSGLAIAKIQRENEGVLLGDREIDAQLDGIREAMFECIERGFRTEGILPGGLRVHRRAKQLHDILVANGRSNAERPHEVLDWVSASAIAVNEMNASGARLVTAPRAIRRGRHCASGLTLLSRLLSGLLGSGITGIPTHFCGDRRIDQAKCVDLGRRGRMSGRSRLGCSHGGSRAGGCVRRNHPADRECSRNCTRTSSWNDLRSGRRSSADSLYRAKCNRRAQGNRSCVTCDEGRW